MCENTSGEIPRTVTLGHELTASKPYEKKNCALLNGYVRQSLFISKHEHPQIHIEKKKH